MTACVSYFRLLWDFHRTALPMIEVRMAFSTNEAWKAKSNASGRLQTAIKARESELPFCRFGTRYNSSLFLASVQPSRLPSQPHHLLRPPSGLPQYLNNYCVDSGGSAIYRSGKQISKSISYHDRRTNDPSVFMLSISLLTDTSSCFAARTPTNSLK